MKLGMRGMGVDDILASLGSLPTDTLSSIFLPNHMLVHAS